MTHAHRLLHIAPAVESVRLTIPAREALERAGNPVRPLVRPGGSHYDVEIVRPPTGLVIVLVGHGDDQSLAIRLDCEPEYPQEWPETAVCWWDRGQWTPCPECGHALVWCEAGFVPGWRVCLVGHAVQLSADGRSGIRHREQDAATVRATRPVAR